MQEQGEWLAISGGSIDDFTLDVLTAMREATLDSEERYLASGAVKPPGASMAVTFSASILDGHIQDLQTAKTLRLAREAYIATLTQQVTAYAALNRRLRWWLVLFATLLVVNAVVQVFVR